MNTRDILKRMALAEADVDAKVAEVFGGSTTAEEAAPATFAPDTILKGRVLDMVGDDFDLLRRGHRANLGRIGPPVCTLA